MKKEIAILGVAGLVLLITSMPYASATTSVEGPDTVPLDSSFTVLVKTNETVDAAHVNITFPSELKVGLITIDPGVLFDFSMYQNGTDWVDVIVAEELTPPVAPTLAEIGFTATQKGTYTIDLTSVINGAVDDVAPLTITVIVPGDVNEDGTVNYQDIVMVIENWGNQVGCPTCDVDRDGNVGYSDISFIVEHWTGP